MTTVTRNVSSPLEYFMKFFNIQLITIIAEETNLYSMQQTAIALNPNAQEMKSFLGIQLYMGVVLSLITDY